MASARRAPTALVALLALAGLALTACGGSSHEHTGPAAIVGTSSSSGGTIDRYGGIVPVPALAVGALALPNVAADGAPLPLRAKPGHVLLVFLGFTHCTDVCPTTMAELRAAVRRLPAADRDRVDVAFITVDPERDTPKVLRDYVTGFFPNGAALRTTDDAQLRKVARALWAAYEVTKRADGTVEVDHTTFVIAIGPDGDVLVQWPYGTKAAAIADGLQELLAEAG